MTSSAPVLAGLPGGYEWLIVLFIILLLFGRRLPGVARSLGQGISSFKKGLADPVGDKDQGAAEPHARKVDQKPAPASDDEATSAD